MDKRCWLHSGKLCNDGVVVDGRCGLTMALPVQVLAQEGVFYLRLCKLCDDGVVVKGEYGVTTALFAHGFNIATLMGMYPPDLDWRDQRLQLAWPSMRAVLRAWTCRHVRWHRNAPLRGGLPEGQLACGGATPHALHQVGDGPCQR